VLRQHQGRLAAVVQIVKLNGYVNSAPGFTDQPAVIDGASDLLQAVFGERGRHARTSVGVAELPGDIPVEIEMVVQVASGDSRHPASEPGMGG
jgi:enamine deaminase RidA (YjgF/YER057c/UK114 family)